METITAKSKNPSTNQLEDAEHVSNIDAWKLVRNEMRYCDKFEKIELSSDSDDVELPAKEWNCCEGK